MSAAATKLGLDRDINFVQWTDSWLKTPGCCEIEMKYEVNAQGNITKFELIQTPYNLANIPENRIRI